MAKTIRDGALFSGTGLSGGISNPIHSAAGRLFALVISHAETTTQTVTLFDDTSGTAGNEIAQIHVNPGQSPTSINFNREHGIAFATGLYLVATNCDVLIWSLDYG
jgi:hypothetical protein